MSKRYVWVRTGETPRDSRGNATGAASMSTLPREVINPCMGCAGSGLGTGTHFRRGESCPRCGGTGREASTVERVLCAAIWYPDGPTTAHGPRSPEGRGFVWCGHNHAAIIESAAFLHHWRAPQEHQGFVTTDNRFVGREEAARIAIAAGQIPPGTDTLYSEDINYPGCRSRKA